MIKALEPLEPDEGIYLYLLTNEGTLYPVRPKGTMQAAAIAQGSVAGGSSETTDDAPPWTKKIRPLLDHAIDETVMISETGVANFAPGTPANTVQQLADLTGGKGAIPACICDSNERWEVSQSAGGVYEGGSAVMAPQGYFAGMSVEQLGVVLSLCFRVLDS